MAKDPNCTSCKGTGLVTVVRCCPICNDGIPGITSALWREQKERLGKAEAQRDALLVALRAVEWVNQDDGGYGSSCPWCNWYAWNGHSDTCIRQFAIAKAKGE